MARIDPIDYQSASIEAKAKYEEQVQTNGRITNMKKTLLHSLPAYDALLQWYPLHREISGYLSAQEINFFCYAISSENDCDLCSIFFRKILKEANIDFDTFHFSEREAILVEIGRVLANQKGKITDEQFAQLQQFWLDAQIISIIAFATIMIATNLFNSALKIEIDDYLLGY